MKYERNDDLNEPESMVPPIINIPDTLSCLTYNPLNPMQNESHMLSMESSIEIVHESDQNGSLVLC